LKPGGKNAATSWNTTLFSVVLCSEEAAVARPVVLGELDLNSLGFAFGSFLGTNPELGIGDRSSNSMLAKISSIKLFSVVEVVVVGLNPGGKNRDTSSCWIVDKTSAALSLDLPRGGP